MWLDERDAVTLSELSQVSGFGPAEVDELVEYGALLPMQPQEPPERPEQLFSAHCITRLRTASKLRIDFDLDLFTVAMLLDYLNQIETLQRQVRALQAHRPSSE